MHSIVISDTSCLIILDKINQLELLYLIYDHVITTPEVALEFNQPIPKWITIKSAINKIKQKELETSIDLGEASALTLALEIKDCILILHDLKARKVAEYLHLNFTGTLGIIVRAKRKGFIKNVKPILENIKSAGLRFSKEVEADILNEAGEL